LLTQAVTEAVNKRYDIILGIDSNAHHPAWGSPDANNRGQILEDFITNYNLSILNEGNAPTFYRTNCATHIDITITTNALKTRIRSWSVLDEDMLSDHFCLHTIIDNSTSFKRQILNYKKTDWDQYKDILILEDWSIAKINSPANIDLAIETLSNHLTNAITQATPKIYISGSHKKEKWWSEELREMRRNLRGIKHRLMSNPNPNLELEYQEHKTAYQKAIRKAKRANWLNFLELCKYVPEASRLARILMHKKSAPPGLTVKPDGTATWDSVESTKNIMKSLFPGSSMTPNSTTSTPNLNLNLNMPIWINQNSVTKLIYQLKPNKAPGPDAITAKMLKNLPNKVIKFLVNIYDNIIKYSHVPQKWCLSKAIFIPKNSKTPKNDPKAYHPICLSNILFKILEKLIQSFLEEGKIYPDKLSNRQHGFHHNRSTLTSLSSVINYIETNSSQNQPTLAVFLDIHGAFDNINPYNAIKKLENWGTHKAITNTLINYYEKCTILTQIAPSNREIKIYPSKGTAQGNVLSPMLWNLVVDQVGSIMDRHNLGGCIFADDIILAASNQDLSAMTNIIQQALNDIQKWSQEEGLKFNTSKSHFMIFHGQNGQNININLNNTNLIRQTSTKYLGVLLNEELKWTDHFNAVFAKAKNDMVIINKALHKITGPSPKLTHWIYTGIIRPKISYAAHIWCGKISNHLLEKKSWQIQRWALTKLGPIREHTPTAGLEIITKTIPLHIHLQEISLKTVNNFLNIEFHLHPAQLGHLSRWLRMLETHLPLAKMSNDKGPKFPAPFFQNKVDESYPVEGATVYTDGSKMVSDCGSGFIIKWEDQTRMGLAYNGKFYTVFLSEVRAIALALEKVIAEDLNSPIIKIYSDCQSAIAAINSSHSSSKVVRYCWELLQKIDRKHNWSLSWVKAHVGNKGNESADKLAKQGTQWGFLGPQPFLPVAPIHIKHAIANFSSSNWETYWNGRVDCRQTKLWFPKPNHKESKNIINLSKSNFGLITRWITGHCFLARHEAIVNNADPICNKCFTDDQTPWHLLKECPTTLQIRSDIPHDHWNTGTLLKTIRKIEYLEVLTGQFDQNLSRDYLSLVII